MRRVRDVRYRRGRGSGDLPPRLISFAVGAAFAATAGSVWANPTGGSVAAGSASFSSSGNALTVTNSPGAIINWQQFSIQRDEITRFIQQNAASAVLNRVVSQNPSTILGTLQSNGRVFLINPSGIAFGAGALIDVAGFAASTLNISDADFLSGRMRFAGSGAEGGITNAGTIRTPEGGQVYLIAPNVENQASGVITSPRGEVVIAAGNTVELVNAGTPDLRVQYTAPANQAVNAGQVLAASGSVGIYGTLIRNSGLVSASAATVGDGGKIVLKAVKDVSLDATSQVQASGAKGGTVTVQGDTGTLLAQGTIEAKGTEDVGGQVELLATQVGLIGTASVDASGQAGGGSVLVGGDFHGANPNVQNASRTYVGSGVTINADAGTQGDGGRVAIWSDDTTRFYGTVSARGGAAGGNGGYAEVSGKQYLIYRGRVDLSAPAGAFGTLLMDPQDITIQASGSNDAELTVNVPSGELADEILFADGGGATNYTLSASTVSGALSNVVLQAQRDISVNSAVSIAQSGVGFVAQAGRNIVVNANLATNNGAIVLEADSPHSPVGGADGVGQITIANNKTVSSAGGHITLIAGGDTQANGGGFNFGSGSSVNAGSGGIDASLTNSGSLSFSLGSSGQTQLSSGDTGTLLTTGALVLGRATTAGTDGQGGTTAITLTVNSLDQATGSALALSPASGSSFALFAGSGGITLDKNLTTFQTTTIDTTGTFTLNAALNTSNNNLVVSASTVNVSGGSITTGSGTFGCTGSGCPSGAATVDQWNVDAGGDWMLGSNWSQGAPPTSTEVALLDRTLKNTYAITLGSAAQTSPVSTTVGLLVNNERLAVTGNALNPTTLNVTSGVSYNNSTSSFNNGTMSLTNAVLGGSGALTNLGTLSLADSTVSAGLGQGIGGALTASGVNAISGPFSMTAGTFGIQSGTTTLSANSNYAGAVTIGNAATLALTGGIQTIYADTTTGSNGSISGVSGSTLNVAGATVTINSGRTLSADVLDLSSGSVGGAGSLTVSTDFNQSGTGTLGTSFTDLSLSRSLGTFNVPALGASHDIALSTTGGQNIAVNGAITSGNHASLISAGAVTLNSGVSASGAGDAIVISGTTFSNVAGPSALSVPGGRWLVYSTNPASDSFGGLVSGNKAIWGTGYPTSVSSAGDRYVFSDNGAVTVTTTSASKTYGQVPLDLSSNYVLSGAPVQGTTTYGSAYLDATAGDIFATGPSISSIGNTSTAHVGGGSSGGAYPITGTGTANSTYTLTFADSGLLTINPAVLTLAGSRPYDGTGSFAASAFGAGGTITTGINGETLTVSGTGSVTSANVIAGVQALNAGTLTLGDGTGLASNYALAGSGNTGAITAKAVTGSITANNKIYDGNNTATIATRTLSGVIGGDLVSYSGGAATFSDKNAGTGKTVTATGLALIGTDALNYTVNSTATTTSAITPATLTIAATTNTKTYDGGVSAAAAPTVSGLVGTDTVTSLVEAYADKNAGSGKTLSVSGYAVNDGNSGGNYTVTTVADTTGVINKAGLTISAVTDSRQYNGTVSSSGTPTASGLQPGDSLSATQVFDSSLAGATNARVLSVNSFTVNDGNGGNNYTAPSFVTALGTISPSLIFPFQWNAGAGSNLQWEVGANWSQGVPPIDGATVSIPAGLPGQIAYSSASGVTSLKALTSDSGLRITGGTLNLGAAQTDVSRIGGLPLTLAGGTLGGNGTVNVLTTLDILTGGVLAGSLLVNGNVNNMAGTVSPGASPGILTINGNYVQGPAGALVIDLAGTAAGTQYDQLVVKGNATLDGTVSANLLNGFVPASGDIFLVLQCGGTLTGAFASTNLPALASLTAAYLPSGVSFTSGIVSAPPLNPITDAINRSPPTSNVLANPTTTDIVGASSQATAYLSTPGGQTLMLTEVSSATPGVYTNVDTGETTTLGTGTTPTPGIYVSDNSQTVVVVTTDESSGKPVVMTAPAQNSGVKVGSKAVLKKASGCK